MEYVVRLPDKYLKWNTQYGYLVNNYNIVSTNYVGHVSITEHLERLPDKYL